MIDLIGQKFGRLLPIKCVGKNNNRECLWLCKCECGNEKIISGRSLRSGATRSCGCLQKEFIIFKNTKHGHAKRDKKSKTHIAWGHMIDRCTNVNNKYYKDYGGRGITICDRWQKPNGEGFRNFLKDMGECPPGLSLDRIDNNKLLNSYSPKNCRWATDIQQHRNTRRNRKIPYGDKEYCLIELSEKYNINRCTLQGRLNSGWSIEDALTILVKKHGKKND